MEQRRLLLLSNLFSLLFQMDAEPSIRGNDARETHVHVGNQWGRFTVETTAKLRPRRQPSKASGRPAEPLAIETKVGRWKHNEADEVLFWSDDDAGKLEAKIPVHPVTAIKHERYKQHAGDEQPKHDDHQVFLSAVTNL